MIDLYTYKTFNGQQVSILLEELGIDYKVKHPKYGKYVRRRTTLGVHDENNVAKIGDFVEVVQCRPYSKTKTWRLVKVLEKKN